MATNVNLAVTLNNLVMTGTIVDNETLDTYAPNASVGLYQLMDSIITNIVGIKNSIKVNEKLIIAHLAKELDTNTTDYTPIATEESASYSSRGATDANLVDNAGVSTKPSILSAGGELYSEDALFNFFQVIGHEISGLRNGTDTTGGDKAGITAIAASIKPQNT